MYQHKETTLQIWSTKENQLSLETSIAYAIRTFGFPERMSTFVSSINFRQLRQRSPDLLHSSADTNSFVEENEKVCAPHRIFIQKNIHRIW